MKNGRPVDEATLDLPASVEPDEKPIWCPQGCGLELKYRQLQKTHLGLACPFCAKIIRPKGG